MSAENGFRYGTKETTWPKGGEWIWVSGQHAKYEKIRKDQHALDKLDNMLLVTEQRLQKTLDLVRYLRALLLGGHVRRDKLAIVQESASAKEDPEDLIAQMVESAKSAGTN